MRFVENFVTSFDLTLLAISLKNCQLNQRQKSLLRCGLFKEFLVPLCNLLGMSLLVVMEVLFFVIALVTDSSGVSRLVLMFALGGKSLPPFRVITIIAHSLGVVLLICMFTVCDLSAHPSSLLRLLLHRSISL